MKKLILCLALAVILIASPAFAWKIQWQVTGPSDGVVMTYHPVSDPAQAAVVDAGTATQVDLDTLSLTVGTRYEFFLQAYTGTPRSFSGESDHIRWTYPTATVIIEMSGAPVNIIIIP